MSSEGERVCPAEADIDRPCRVTQDAKPSGLRATKHTFDPISSEVDSEEKPMKRVEEVIEKEQIEPEKVEKLETPEMEKLHCEEEKVPCKVGKVTSEEETLPPEGEDFAPEVENLTADVVKLCLEDDHPKHELWETSESQNEEMTEPMMSDKTALPQVLETFEGVEAVKHLDVVSRPHIEEDIVEVLDSNRTLQASEVTAKGDCRIGKEVRSTGNTIFQAFPEELSLKNTELHQTKPSELREEIHEPTD